MSFMLVMGAEPTVLQTIGVSREQPLFTWQDDSRGVPSASHRPTDIPRLRPRGPGRDRTHGVWPTPFTTVVATQCPPTSPRRKVGQGLAGPAKRIRHLAWLVSRVRQRRGPAMTRSQRRPITNPPQRRRPGLQHGKALSTPLLFAMSGQRVHHGKADLVHVAPRPSSTSWTRRRYGLLRPLRTGSPQWTHRRSVPPGLWPTWWIAQRSGLPRRRPTWATRSGCLGSGQADKQWTAGVGGSIDPGAWPLRPKCSRGHLSTGQPCAAASSDRAPKCPGVRPRPHPLSLT
jgi:hypothetical protein